VALLVTAALVLCALVAGLTYVLASRRARPLEQPDLTPAIQQAAREATAHAMDSVLKMNEELRKRESEVAVEALD
jgi:hypothetical protein